MTGIEPTVVVVDATFLKDLHRADSVARIERASRIAHLEVAPSIPNVLEALKHPNMEIRTELVSALRRWTRVRPLNPWPFELLRLAGEALPESDFYIAHTELDRLVDKPAQLLEDHEKAVGFLTALEQGFAEAFNADRPLFQAKLKATRQKYAWPDIPSFLASPDWSGDDTQQHLVGQLWELSGIVAPVPPLMTVRKSEVWRIALDIFGAATYARVIRPNRQANPPGLIDLLQLLYLTKHTRGRIFLTDDEALLETASQLLRGRYPNVRVMRGAEFLAQAV